MTPLQNLTINIEALDELINSSLEEREADKEILKRYNGFGGIKEVNFDLDNDDHWNNTNQSIRTKLIELRNTLTSHYGSSVTDKVFNSMRTSTLSAFYTPEQVSNPIVNFFDKIGDLENRKFNLLEPSSGTGVFVNPLLKRDNFTSITSIEKDILTASIQRKINENDKIKVYSGGYENIINNDENKNRRFDLILSNIPFGDIKVHDSEFNKFPNSSIEYNSQNTIHNYFFVKSISKLEKNGYLAFITSTAIADNINNDSLRRDILKKCELVTALRLPNSTFENTKVVSDLIILKRRERTLTTLNDLTEKEKSFLKVDKIEIQHNSYLHESSVNNYFLDENKNTNENVIGNFVPGFFHNKPMVTISSDLTLDEIGNKLENHLTNFLPKEIEKKVEVSTDLFNQAPAQLSLFDDIEPIIREHNVKSTQKVENSNILLNDKIINENHLVEGNLFFYENKIGNVEFSSNGPILKVLALTDNINVSQLKLSSEILITYKKLREEDYINSNSPKSIELRQSLNDKYDQYLKDYGQFSLKQNSFINKFEVEFVKLSGLEIYNEKSFYFDKSDIFFQDRIETTTIETNNLEDAVSISLNQKKEIDVNYISQITGKDVNDVIYQGLEQNLFFIDPFTNQNFDVKEEYVTLKDAEKEPDYKFVTKDEFISGPVAFKILELEQNKDWFINEAVFDNSINLLNENKLHFVPIDQLEPKLGENWIPKNHYEVFASELFNSRFHIIQQSNSSYNVKQEYYSYKANNEFSVECKNGKRINAEKLLEYALHGSSPRITYTIKYDDNTQKTFLDREAMSKAQMKIDVIHKEWFDFLLKNPTRAKEIENIYNNVQNINVERVYDGSHLKLENLKNFTPYKHQKDCIWQLVTANGGLGDHIVGAGKSLIIAGTAMELKRLNVANKPMIIGLKSNINDIYKDMKKAYPDAKILYPTEKEFSPVGRSQFFQKIQNNNWDAVILSHEQFSTIPQSREMQEKIIEDELKNIRLDLKEATENKEIKITKRVLTSLQKRIENKEARLLSIADSIKKEPNLVTFDKLGIDHLIIDEAHVFKNLEFSTRHTNVAGLGNPDGSARALNLLFAVRTLQEMHNGDKGVSFFTGTPISNTLAELYLLKKYLTPTELEKRNMPNFDSWARTYAELSRDFELSVTNEIKMKERYRSFQKIPELARWYRSFSNVANENNIVLDRPKISNNLVNIDNTPLQKQLSKDLVDAVTTENFSKFGVAFDENQLAAKMLIATNISSKISMDVRMIDNEYTQDEGSKANEAAKNIASNYFKSNSYKGTQLVFCDFSTPNADKDKFTIYKAVKETLVNKYNIPENQIQFIHDHDTKKSREKIYKDVNNGEVRVLFGSTAKMGVGVNVQEKVIAMHHLDIPWSPKDLIQRNGRGERQGNIAAKLYNNNTVENYIYATEGTLDAYKYYLVDLKQKFINQIKNSNITSRKIDEGEMGDDGVLSASAFIAQLSGKQELLEKNKIDKQIAELEMKKSVVLKDMRNLENDVSRLTNLIPKIEKRKEDYQIDLKERNAIFKNEKGLSFVLNDNNNNPITDKEKIKEYLVNKVKSHNSQEKENYKIASIGNFNLLLNGYIDKSEKEPIAYIRFSIESKLTNLEYIYNSGFISAENPNQLYKQAFDSIKNLEGKILDQDRSLIQSKDTLEKNLELLPKMDAKQFDNELDILKNKSNELSLIIENENSNIEKNIEINEKINAHITKGDYKGLNNYVESLDNSEKPNLYELITKTDSLSIEKKEEALIELVYNKQLNSIIKDVENGNAYYESVYLKERFRSTEKPTEIEIKQVLNAQLSDECKSGILTMLKADSPSKIISEAKEIKNNDYEPKNKPNKNNNLDNIL